MLDTTTSNTVTLPARTITITGKRAKVEAGNELMTVSGTSVKMPAGTTLTARFAASRNGLYTDGVTVTVAANGIFTWKREVNKGKTLWVYFIGGKAISNTLKFPPT